MDELRSEKLDFTPVKLKSWSMSGLNLVSYVERKKMPVLK